MRWKTYIRVQRCKNQLAHQAHCVRTRIQLIQKPLIPCIHRVLQYTLYQIYETISSDGIFPQCLALSVE